MSQSDDDILTEVMERHRHCSDVEASARNNYRDDMRFLYGDAYNSDQWDPAVITARSGSGGVGNELTLVVGGS